MGKKKTNIKLKSITVSDSLESISKLNASKVVQANQFVECIFEQPFNELELKVLCLISKYINESKFNTGQIKVDETMKVTINKEEFCNLLEINQLNFYHQMNSLSNNLTSKKIKIKSLKNRNFMTMVLFPAVGYENGEVVFHISDLLRPYLLHLKSDFTSFLLPYIVKLSSSHAIKLYLLLKQYQVIKKRNFTIDELKNILGISDCYINSFKNFKREVIIIAQRQINEFTDLNIDFETDNTPGKKAKEITFHIEIKQSQYQQTMKLFKKDMNLMVEDFRFRNEFTDKDKENWNTKKNKNFEEYSDFFNSWLEEKVKSYAPESTKKLTETNNKSVLWFSKVARIRAINRKITIAEQYFLLSKKRIEEQFSEKLKQLDISLGTPAAKRFEDHLKSELETIYDEFVKEKEKAQKELEKPLIFEGQPTINEIKPEDSKLTMTQVHDLFISFKKVTK